MLKKNHFYFSNFHFTVDFQNVNLHILLKIYVLYLLIYKSNKYVIKTIIQENT